MASGEAKFGTLYDIRSSPREQLTSSGATGVRSHAVRGGIARSADLAACCARIAGASRARPMCARLRGHKMGLVWSEHSMCVHQPREGCSIETSFAPRAW